MGSEEHIVMLPFMAHGHLIPFLALAKQIRRRTGFTVTIATTSLNAQYLRSSLASSSSDDEPNPIRLEELHFSGADHGLPPGAENSENLPLDLIVNLFHASSTLQTPVHELVTKITAEQGGRPPLCIVSDIFFGWANDVAEATGTKNFTFSTGGAYGSLAYISIWMNLPHRKNTGSDEFAVPGFPEDRRFHITQLHQFLRKADGEDPWSRFFQPQISKSLEKSSGWLCNSVEEIEPLGFELFRKYSNRQIWGIAPLLPPEVLQISGSKIGGSRQRSGKTPGVSAEKCLEWLESHEPGSVLYISFGSQNSINPSQMMELAIGLEESSVNFLWVIRPPIGFDRKSEFRPEWLPDGFERRMGETKKGLLVRNWAPQLEILSHGSIGGFISHCGWNSVLESLSQGVPIIGWPLAAEQAYNSKLLVEEMGVAVELTRGAQGELERERVKEVVEMMMGKNEKAEGMKRKAVEVSEHFRAAIRDDDGETNEKKGSSVRAMDDFVATVLTHR